MNLIKQRPPKTVQGVAGSGKSTLVHILVNLLRSMFGTNKCVHVTAPTGAAAYNIGGETLHRTAGIKVNNENDPPSEEK